MFYSKVFIIVMSLFVILSTMGCSSTLYGKSRALSIAKMEDSANSADVDKIRGYTCTIINSTSDRATSASHIIVRSVTLGVRDGWDGFLRPGQKISVRLLPGKYFAEAWNSHGKKYEDVVIKDVVADGHVYDGTQYVTQTFVLQN